MDRRQSLLHDENCAIGHGFTMDIAKGLSIYERTCYACIAHLDPEVEVTVVVAVVPARTGHHQLADVDGGAASIKGYIMAGIP